MITPNWVGAPVSTGTLAAFMAKGAEDLQPFLDEIHAQVTAAPVAHFDEASIPSKGVDCCAHGKQAVEELLDTIEALLAFSRAGTFDEEVGEREVRDRAQNALGRYRRAT